MAAPHRSLVLIATLAAPIFFGRAQIPVPPEAIGKPVDVPDDLIEAGRRWSNETQAALLARGNPHLKISFSFAVLGDSEIGRFPWERMFPPDGDAPRRLLRSIHDKRPDFIFRLGDMVSEGNVASYREHVAFLEQEARIPVFSIIGNHDRSRPNGSADKRLYQVVFGKTDFYFDYNGWRFVGLDSSDRLLRNDQLEWLDQALDTPQRKIIFTHVPPFFIKGKLSHCPPRALAIENVAALGYWKDFMTGFFKRGSPEFEEIAARRGVERVYMGHIHAFGMADHRGTRYILSGGGGSPLYFMPGDMPQCRITHFLEVSAGPGPIGETGHFLDGGSFSLP